MQQIPDPRGRILSDDARVAFADVAGKLGDHFQKYIDGSLSYVIADVKDFWGTLLPWALLILLRYVVLLERIEGASHHLLLSSQDSCLISPLLRLLTQLSALHGISECMAQSPAFVAVLTNAWMILVPHKEFRLHITLATSVVGRLNEARHLASITSFTPALSLPALDSIMYEFTPRCEVDYAHLESVMWSMEKIICGSPKDCIFCSSLAVHWVFRTTGRLCNLKSSDIPLGCLIQAFSLIEVCIRRVHFRLVEELVGYSLLKLIHRYPWGLVAHEEEMVQLCACIMRLIAGSFVWLPVLKQVKRQITRINNLNYPPLPPALADSWDVLQDTAESYQSYYLDLVESACCTVVCSLFGCPELLSHNGQCGESCSRYCGRCKSIFYCSRDCQKLDWHNDHREICKVWKGNALLSIWTQL